MALYTSKGTITDMSEVKSGKTQSGYDWARMTIVIEVPGFQGSTTKLALDVIGVDDIKEVSLLSAGDKVEVIWTIYARNWNGRWYNNVELFKIRKLEETKPSEPAPAPIADELDPMANNDLPF